MQITGLFVPTEVKNGSDHVLLDCEYSLRPDELQPASGLVVKWFYNNSPAPVYQWIPGNKPQVQILIQIQIHLVRSRLLIVPIKSEFSSRLSYDV